MTGPVIPRGRRPLGAHITGPAVLWIWNNLADKGERSVVEYWNAGNREMAISIGIALAELREATRQHLESEDRPVPSDPGSAEALPLPSDRDCERMASPSGKVPAKQDVHAASIRLRVSERRVRQLLAAGTLTGWKSSTGHWSIDSDDLDRLVADRRATDE